MKFAERYPIFHWYYSNICDVWHLWDPCGCWMF